VYRVNEMTGKPVVSVAGGEKLGEIADALIDPGRVSLIGLVVGNGRLGKEHVLPFDDVQTVGRDAVLVRTDEHLMTPRAWREAEISATRSTALRGRRVITAAGDEVGHVSDVLIDEANGTFAGLEVDHVRLPACAAGAPSFLLTRRRGSVPMRSW